MYRSFFMSAARKRTLFSVTPSLAEEFDISRFNTILHGNILRHTVRRFECRWMRRSRENNIRDTRDVRAASLANSSGCRFSDRASPRLCAYSRASREESVAVKKNERIKRTFIWEMMRNQGASAAQWRGRCCIREEMKRAEGIRRYWKDKIKRDGERGSSSRARKGGKDYCKGMRV